MSRFLIIQTGTTLPELRSRRGDFAQWFLRTAGLNRHDVELVRADLGEPLPLATRFAGVLVTGSASMVTERHNWSEYTGDWLAQALRTNACAVLGVCYGHQLLAHCLGGQVDWNPTGRQIGTKPLTPSPAASYDPLFGLLTGEFRAQTTHQQAVVVVPAGAQILAVTPQDPHHALRLSERAWGVQFHPEFSAGVMAGYIRARRQDLVAEGLDPARLLRECGPTPGARQLLRRFVALAGYSG